MNSTSASASPMLNLPPELRNTIYRLALTTDGDVIVDKNTLPARLALLNTCTTIRDEATCIFYAENTFELPLNGETNDASLAWIGSLGNVAKFIESLTLRVGMTVCYYQTQRAASVHGAAPQSRATENLDPFCDQQLTHMERIIKTTSQRIVDEIRRAYDAGLGFIIVEIVAEEEDDPPRADNIAESLETFTVWFHVQRLSRWLANETQRKMYQMMLSFLGEQIG